MQAEGGSILPTFALSLLPVLGMIAVGADYSQATKARTHDQEILDTAVLSAVGQRDSTKAQTVYAAILSQGLQPGSTASPLTIDTTNPSAFQVRASISGSRSMSFGSFIGQMTLPYTVRSSALAGYKPTSATVSVSYVKGYWYKVITLYVHRPNATSDTALMTITYQPTNLSSNGGIGVGTATISGPGLTTVSASGLNLALASGTIQLGDYDKLYFQMAVEHASCAPGYAQTSKSTNTSIKCGRSSGSTTAFDATFRTDDPNTSEYLFVDKVQQPHGVVVPIDTMMPCAATGANQEWEDGGGFASQDFGFTIVAACSTPDANNVRLTQ